jgi:hypothetical protein
MKRSILFALIVAAALTAWLGAPGIVLAMATAAPTTDDNSNLAWRRVRRDLPAFQNVVATGYASCLIPRYGYTLHGASLKLGGTTFNETHILEVRLMLGAKTLWLATGAHLRTMNAVRGLYDGNRQFLHVSFTNKRSKAIGGEFVGGIDMSSLPPGDLQLRVQTSGATAPTLSAKGHWGPPQANDIMQKLLQFTWAATATGRLVVPLAFGGARLRRLYFITGGTDWVNSAPTSSAWTGNTGNGVMGAITVPANTKVGVWKLVIVKVTANAGDFLLYDPDGIPFSLRGTVAVAFAGTAAPNFTLGDGATDWVVGDGFDITVTENDNGNMSRLEVIKNGEAVWDYTDAEARNIQKIYGLVPQTKTYLADFELDQWPDGALPTADARTLEIAGTFTATDASITIYAEVLDKILNN